MFIFMAHLLLFQPVISFWGWQYFGSGDEGNPCISIIFSSSIEEFDTFPLYGF